MNTNIHLYLEHFYNIDLCHNVDILLHAHADLDTYKSVRIKNIN